MRQLFSSQGWFGRSILPVVQHQRLVGISFAQFRQRFQAQVALGGCPLIVMLKQQRIHEPDGRGWVGEDCDDGGASLDRFVQLFERVGRVQFGPQVVMEGATDQGESPCAWTYAPASAIVRCPGKARLIIGYGRVPQLA